MNIKRSIAFMLLASFLLCVLFGCESGSGFAPEYPRVAMANHSNLDTSCTS